jgi:hypothetical protein
MPRRGLMIVAFLSMCGGCLVSFEDYPVAEGDARAGASGSPDAAFGGSAGTGADAGGGVSGTGGSPLDGSSECDANEACVAASPSDWNGPIAFWSGQLNSSPDCPPDYPQHNNAAFTEISQGGCGPCTCAASCQVTATTFDDIACGGTVAANQTLGTCELALTSSPSSLVAVATPTCSIQPPTPAALASSFGKSTVACDLAQTQQSCSLGVCRPIPPSGFGLCIYKVGDESCPSGAYANRIVTYSGIQELHTCASCGCQAAGSCVATVGVASDSACSSGFKQCLSTEPCCAWPNEVAAAYLKLVDAQGASCAPTGGAVMGQDIGTGAITYCCL